MRRGVGVGKVSRVCWSRFPFRARSLRRRVGRSGQDEKDKKELGWGNGSEYYVVCDCDVAGEGGGGAVRNACLACTFLICLLLSHAYARFVRMRERKDKIGRGPGCCDWAPRSCRENQVLDDEISAWRYDGGTVVEADRMRKRPIRMLRAESHRVGGPPLSRFGPRHPVGRLGVVKAYECVRGIGPPEAHYLLQGFGWGPDTRERQTGRRTDTGRQTDKGS